ncbi:TSC22 domain family protein 1 isoform X1 [Pseudorasbora parva]|uniref:TSC22 domain family protein 1 isoform X1 n=1 Tax=Pseudorasbora parva TaxID=51549 RepID=UPI00351EC8CF
MHHPESTGENRRMSHPSVFSGRRGSGAAVPPDEPHPSGSSSPGPLHHPHSLNLQSTGTKKKSGFQITSVLPAQVSASGNNSIADDTESYDDLSHTEDLSSSDMLDVSVSRATDTGVPVRSSSEETLNSVHGSETPGVTSPNEPVMHYMVNGVHQKVVASAGSPVPLPTAPPVSAAASRFRVVKLDSNSEPFRKGRWTCAEYYEKDPPSGDAAVSAVNRAVESVIQTEHDSTSSSSTGSTLSGGGDAGTHAPPPVSTLPPVDYAAPPPVSPRAAPVGTLPPPVSPRPSARTAFPPPHVTASQLEDAHRLLLQHHSLLSLTGGFPVPDAAAALGPAGAFAVSTGADEDSSSGASVVAIDNKIEQAMDLVKSHLMYAVREEVEVLKEQIKELMEKNSQLEQENALLKTLASPEQLAQFQAQVQSSSPTTGVPNPGPGAST